MDLHALLESTLVGLGYELVELEMSNRGKMLRIYIDSPNGIKIEDCTLVSNHLSRLLAVELDYDYDRLEVSSPGLDRPLRKEADFIRFAGEKAQIKMRVPVNGQRNFIGVLQEVQEGLLKLEVDGTVLSLDLAAVEKARLIPNI
ncbi:ribosome maturation factor RimP [Sulfurirhabdus autotrophica]|uniref:Ribosome maturation factor RimP n=1 Tax=Sulfurirhabdus autotrophica TaxID=1706046 RepID=A0A4R3YIQ2_9PROT|nr:ribosome maturation factor RimP [Sulfurirhabdus autotrophica]TCV90884.1 ribosome maturation factor RimP [Sulfurirhabdus autotrophica]